MKDAPAAAKSETKEEPPSAAQSAARVGRTRTTRERRANSTPAGNTPSSTPRGATGTRQRQAAEQEAPSDVVAAEKLEPPEVGVDAAPVEAVPVVTAAQHDDSAGKPADRDGMAFLPAVDDIVKKKALMQKDAAPVLPPDEPAKVPSKAPPAGVCAAGSFLERCLCAGVCIRSSTRISLHHRTLACPEIHAVLLFNFCMISAAT